MVGFLHAGKRLRVLHRVCLVRPLDAAVKSVSNSEVFVAFGHYWRDTMSGYKASFPQPCPEVTCTEKNFLDKCEQVMVFTGPRDSQL